MAIREGLATCTKCGAEFPAAAGEHPGCPEGPEPDATPDFPFFESEPPFTEEPGE